MSVKVGGICLIEKKMNCMVRFFETMRKKVRYKKSLKNKKRERSHNSIDA